MIVPRFTQERCLILTDTDVESLLATAMAAEQQSISSTDPSQLVPAWWEPYENTELDLVISAIEPALKRHADMYAMPAHPSHAYYPPEDGQDSAESLAEHQTRILTEAAYLAIHNGLRRVVWPIRVPSSHPDRITAIGNAIDRAMLISRLVSLDATQNSAPEVQIETPFIDLSDAQMHELIRDMALPIDSCWWAQAQTIPLAQIRAEHWLGGEPRGAIQLEPKPGVQSPT